MSKERGGPYISVMVSYQEVDRRPLKGALTIGRSLDAGLRLEDTILSRLHCRLEPMKDGKWAVVDLASRNGTFLNAARVKERTILKDGDIVTVGRAHITFHAHGYEPPRIAPTPLPRDPNAETLFPGDSGVGMKPLPFTRTPPSPKPK